MALREAEVAADNGDDDEGPPFVPPTEGANVYEALTDEECYLYAILTDPSGLDLAEFTWVDEDKDDGCWRAWPFQWAWWRCEDMKQIDQCVAGGQRVHTERGEIPIEDVLVGDMVLTHRNRYRRVTAIWDQGDRPVVQIRADSGHRVLTTSDHHVYSDRDGDPEWLAPDEWEGAPVRVQVQGSDGPEWVAVTGVRTLGEARVYDLEVEEDQSFVVEGVTVHNCGRSVGKSESIMARACSFPFRFPGQEMVITAPEGIHADAITERIEGKLKETRLLLEMIRGGLNGFKHKPFHCNFINGARIMGRIPQKTGTGIKGTHPVVLELDEAQDYPEKGWTEIRTTLKRGSAGAQWRVHGVTKGLPDDYYDATQEGSGFTVHHYTAMHRPTWTDEERDEMIREFKSKNDPDYRRNILGIHGDATNAIFDLSRLMRCQVAGTLVSVVDPLSQAVGMVPIEDVQVGATVLNAVGTGVVTDAISSERADIVRVWSGGHQVTCTSDHPFFTGRGWVRAGRLRKGDRVFTPSSVLELWKAPGEAEEVLLPSVLAGRDSEGPKDLSDLPTAVLRLVPEDYVQPRMFGNSQEAAEPTARGDLPAMWGPDSDRQGYEALLQPGVLEGIASSPGGGSDVRDVRGNVPLIKEQAVLREDLLREVGWTEPRENGGHAGDQGLRALRGGVLPTEQGDPLLLPLVQRSCEGGEGAIGAWPPGSPMLELRRTISTETRRPSFLHAAMRLRRAGGRSSAAATESHVHRSTRRLTPAAVRSVDGARRDAVGVETTILGQPAWGTRGRSGLHYDRPRSSKRENRGRGGRQGPSQGEVGGAGPVARWVALLARVDRVEVLKFGDPEFNRLSGGRDSITVYDLTVAGHPSFFVGEGQFLVHNCVDQEQASAYNTQEYWFREIRIEQIEDRARRQNLTPEAHGDILCEMLQFPEEHTRYKAYWAGMDVGITRDPSAIVVFGEYLPDRAELRRDQAAGIATPLDGATRLKLLLRLELLRIPTTVQVEAILKVIEFYKPRAFTMDKTGNGLGMLQQLQQLAMRSRLMRVEIIDDEAGVPLDEESVVRANEALTTIKGYNFGGKVVVAIDEEKAAALPAGVSKEELIDKAGIKRLVKEYATDKVRDDFVDRYRLLLPWDRTLLKQMNGQTFVFSPSPVDSYGNRRRVYSEGQFHSFDGVRMAILGKMMEAMEAFLETTPVQEPVLDIFGGEEY